MCRSYHLRRTPSLLDTLMNYERTFICSITDPRPHWSTICCKARYTTSYSRLHAKIRPSARKRWILIRLTKWHGATIQRSNSNLIWPKWCVVIEAMSSIFFLLIDDYKSLICRNTFLSPQVSSSSVWGSCHTGGWYYSSVLFSSQFSYFCL